LVTTFFNIVVGKSTESKEILFCMNTSCLESRYVNLQF